MGAISCNRFRKDPDKVIDEVVDAEGAVTVTREDGRNVAIIPATEFESKKRCTCSAAKEIEAGIARRRR